MWATQPYWKLQKVYSNTGGSVFQDLYMLAHLALFEQFEESIVLCCNLAVQVFVIGFFKTLHAEPRPFWVDKDIIPGGCTNQFGNPSGHSLTALFFSLYLWNKHFKKQSSIIKVTSFIFLLAAGLEMGHSRFVLGLHSANQILYGDLLGLWCLIFCIFFMEPKLRQIMDDLKAGNG